jgi:hypothetical protein
VKQKVVRDSDPIQEVEVPAEVDVLCGLPDVFGDKNVLVRAEYAEALKAVTKHRKTHGAIVVVGHPGIGMIS